MPQPQAYAPIFGQQYQLLTRYNSNGPAWEHCDYCADKEERAYLLAEYRTAYGAGFSFKVIALPRKYHRAAPLRPARRRKVCTA